MREEYWITGNGHRLAVGDMNLVHCRNALRTILRQKRLEQERADSKSAPAHQVLEYQGSPEEQVQRKMKEYKHGHQ